MRFDNNQKEKQYELHVEGNVAKIEYILSKSSIYLTHTEVPDALAGKGIGTRLLKHALNDVIQQDLELVALCPFVARYIQRNPDWKVKSDQP